MNTEPIETPTRAYMKGPVSRDLDAITAHVRASKGLGARAASRYVGRRFNKVTRANFRRTGQFPIGFRQASKAGYRPTPRALSAGEAKPAS